MVIKSTQSQNRPLIFPFVCVPILSVMNYLGAKIIDKENVYVIKYNGKKLKIDFDKKIIHTEDSELNLLGLPTGGKVFYSFIGNDVISCGPSLTCVLSFLGLGVGYHVYNDSKTIKIELIDQSGDKTNLGTVL